MAVGAADRVIANRYALKTALGRTELGTLWRAQDMLLGREVVVREIVLPTWLAGAERRTTQASVLREAGAVARLNHPGVLCPVLRLCSEAVCRCCRGRGTASELPELRLGLAGLLPFADRR